MPTNASKSQSPYTSECAGNAKAAHEQASPSEGSLGQGGLAGCDAMNAQTQMVDATYWYEQAELAVAYAMSRAPGDSKGWESAMADATEFRRLAALAGGASHG